MRLLRRFGDSVSDAWFAVRIWVRYDLPRAPVAALGVLLVVSTVVLLVVPRQGGAAVGAGGYEPVALPTETIAPSKVSPLPRPPADVLVVGDSLVAGEEDLYREELAEVGVTMPVFDAAVSRGLRRGWLCPEGASVPDIEAGGSAAACRMQGIDVVASFAVEDRLPRVVVMALGTNDASVPVARVLSALDELREVLGDRRLVLLATATFPMGEFYERWNATTSAWCAADVSCVFVDWFPVGASAEFFAPDGLHLSGVGSRWRAEALAAALSQGF